MELRRLLLVARARADRALANGDPKAAANNYRFISHRIPDDTEVSLLLARCLNAYGRDDAAAIECLRLAGLCAQLSRPRHAVALVDKALGLAPAVVVQHRLARIVFGLGRHADAVCDRVVAMHIAADRVVEARDMLLSMVDADPGCGAKRLRLALTELRLGRVGQAVRYLRPVARMYQATGDPDFEPVAELLLEHGGSNRELLEELVARRLHQGRYQEALVDLEQLHHRHPTDRQILERLALTQAHLGRSAQAAGSLLVLVGLLRRGGADDEAAALLGWARGWSQTRQYRHAIDTLARQVLDPADARKVTGVESSETALASAA